MWNWRTIVSSVAVAGFLTSAAYGLSDNPAEDQIAETIRLSAPYEDLRAGFTVKIETESGHGSGFHIGLVRVENPYRLKTANLSCRTPAANESISAPGNPMGLEFVTSHGHVPRPRPTATSQARPDRQASGKAFSSPT